MGLKQVLSQLMRLGSAYGTCRWGLRAPRLEAEDDDDAFADDLGDLDDDDDDDDVDDDDMDPTQARMAAQLFNLQDSVRQLGKHLSSLQVAVVKVSRQLDGMQRRAIEQGHAGLDNHGQQGDGSLGSEPRISPATKLDAIAQQQLAVGQQQQHAPSVAAGGTADAAVAARDGQLGGRELQELQELKQMMAVLMAKLNVEMPPPAQGS